MMTIHPHLTIIVTIVMPMSRAVPSLTGNAEFPLCGEGVLLELVQAPADVIEHYKD